MGVRELGLVHAGGQIHGLSEAWFVTDPSTFRFLRFRPFHGPGSGVGTGCMIFAARWKISGFESTFLGIWDLFTDDIFVQVLFKNFGGCRWFRPLLRMVSTWAVDAACMSLVAHVSHECCLTSVFTRAPREQRCFPRSRVGTHMYSLCRGA